jgi:hypothetical protein
VQLSDVQALLAERDRRIKTLEEELKQLKGA